MSHDEDDGVHVFTCDACGEEYSGDPGDTFQDTWRIAKNSGWRSFKEDNEWVHRCPLCVGKRRSDDICV
jgi:hypothetical protein